MEPQIGDFLLLGFDEAASDTVAICGFKLTQGSSEKLRHVYRSRASEYGGVGGETKRRRG